MHCALSVVARLPCSLRMCFAMELHRARRIASKFSFEIHLKCTSQHVPCPSIIHLLVGLHKGPFATIGVVTAQKQPSPVSSQLKRQPAPWSLQAVFLNGQLALHHRIHQHQNEADLCALAKTTLPHVTTHQITNSALQVGACTVSTQPHITLPQKGRGKRG